MRGRRSLGLAACILAVTAACKREVPEAPWMDPNAVGVFRGGVITRAQLDHEVAQLPPELRRQTLAGAGREELVRAMIDKRLLVAEARSRGIAERPEVKRQVIEFEERLILRTLLDEEEQASPSPTEAELRAWYQAHPDEVTEPERARLARILLKEGPVKQRAASLLARLRAGEPATRLAELGDGPERVRGGDIGWVAATDDGVEAVAARSLKAVGDLVEVQTSQGLAILVLMERKERRLPPFEEVRPTLAGRMRPARQRHVFDSLLSRLRKNADVRVSSN